jgi:EmrB/QacA subfamily drug resistance transporter
MRAAPIEQRPHRGPSALLQAAGPPVRRLWPIMASLIFALVPLQVDALVTATASPTIAGDLGGFDRIAWIATAYLLTMAIGTVLAGRLGDMFGRKRMLLLATSVFFVGSFLAGVSGSMTEFIAARAVQGLGAGMTFTTLLAVIADVVPSDRRARYQGMLGAIAPFTMILGPWVGGIITDHLGWRWIFFLNLPLVAVSILGAAVLLRLPVGRRGGRVDYAGLVAVSTASTGIVLALTWGGHQYTWGSWQVLGAVALCLTSFACLVVVERRAKQPIFPPDLFNNRSVLISFVVLFLAMGAVMASATNFLPLFLQLVQGRSASSSGLLLLPMLLPVITVSLLAGYWVTTAARFRPVMIAGTAVLATGCALLATMGPDTTAWVTATYMVLVGVGIGLLFQTPLVLVQNNAPAQEVGAATGAASFLRMIGSAIGVGALGSLFTGTIVAYLSDHAAIGTTGLNISSLTPGQLGQLPTAARTLISSAVTSGNSALFWVAAGAAVLALLAALTLPREQRQPAPRDTATPPRS